MWLDILQTELNFGITKLSLLTSKTKRIVTYYTQRQCHFDDFFRDILSCGQLILCCVGNSRSLSITVRIKNACSICVGKMVWKKSDSDYFQLSEMVLWNREIVCVCVCVLCGWMCVGRSVVSNSLQPHGLYSTRFPCPCNSPGRNTGVGCHFLIQRTFELGPN